MHKRCHIFLLLLFIPFFVLSAQESNKGIKFNAGVKLGFQAATYNITKFRIEGYKYDDSAIQSNKTGYAITPFARLSIGRSYIQTEAVLSVSRHNFEFKEINPADQLIQLPTEYNLTTYCIQVPLLYGHNFVFDDIYGMSFFTGPKAKFIFTGHDKQEFINFSDTSLYEDLRPIVFFWEIGLGVKISRFFFDFAYDFGFTDNTRGVVSKKKNKRFDAERIDNLLSFSVGMIF